MFKQIPVSVKLLVLLFLINTIFVVASFSMSDMSLTSIDEASLKGEKLFKANCSGCHLNGQNLIKADKPIVGSTKLQSKQMFKKFLESPPKPMPKFENITSMNSQFNSLYNYVITLMGT